MLLRVKIGGGRAKGCAAPRVGGYCGTSIRRGGGTSTHAKNIQFHFVKLENVGAAMRLLADAGLTTREACGNTVRKRHGLPSGGICPGEAFDVTPYALGVSR